MANTSQIELNFLGQKICVKSSADKDLVNEVADLVTQKLTEATKRGQGLAAHQVALLALLDITEEYVMAKRRVMEHRIKIDEKSKELSAWIENELKGGE